MSPREEYGLARGGGALVACLVVATALMATFDLVFLGVIAKPFYDAQLGALRAAQVYWPAAAVFYALYVAAIVLVAALPAKSAGQAAWRGAGLGLFAYGVYELTNWAVINGWPAGLVPVDVAWGVALTASVAAGARAAVGRWLPRAEDWMAPFEVQRLEGESWGVVWGRRAVSFSVLAALATVAALGAPAWILAAAVWDATAGPRGKWAKVRALTFFCLFLLCEALGLAAAAVIWLVTLGGRLVSAGRYVDYHVALQRRWTDALLFGSLRIFSMRLQVEGAEVATPPYVLWVRHVSTADTVLAAAALANPHRVPLVYAMKREVLWDPCLDVVGRRLPNAFLARGARDTGADLAAITRLAEELPANGAVLMYPEGTRFSPSRRARALERLRARDDDALLELGASMQHVLPPRLGGVLALMEAAPELDVVVLAHTGFEGARTFADFWAGGLVGATLRVGIWRHSVPALAPDARPRWVFERWSEVDTWVTQHQRQSSAE